jgi:alkylated DNA repair dioxygenase AlkB
VDYDSNCGCTWETAFATIGIVVHESKEMHMKQSLAIRDGGLLIYDDAFYATADADSLFATLRDDTPWRQERGRFGPFPRLTAWYADVGLTYTYSGVTHHAIEWTLTLARIRRDVEEASKATFNSLLLNYYRDGQDSMGYHADDEPELGKNPVIASVSFGGARRFLLKHKKSGEKMTFELGHGSLLVMGGTCQHYWIHCVPKTKLDVDERINLTFRNIKSEPEA